MHWLAIVVAVLTVSSGASAAEPISLYAAGSLRGALNEVIVAYEREFGEKVKAKYGASGQLKDEIIAGAKVDVFASANMEHPLALEAAKKSGPVVLFAQNKLCALVRPGLVVTPATVLDRMLDGSIKVGTSTPVADPSGDYAFEVFRKADKIDPGAQALLEKKALKLTGGPSNLSPQQGRSVNGWHVVEGRADIFLAYCTAAFTAKSENPDQQIVALPDNLAVGADYGMTIMVGAPKTASRFGQFVVGPDGQRILAQHGFGAPGLPK